MRGSALAPIFLYCVAHCLGFRICVRRARLFMCCLLFSRSPVKPDGSGPFPSAYFTHTVLSGPTHVGTVVAFHLSLRLRCVLWRSCGLKGEDPLLSRDCPTCESEGETEWVFGGIITNVRGSHRVPSAARGASVSLTSCVLQLTWSLHSHLDGCHIQGTAGRRAGRPRAGRAIGGAFP